jgi:hypothetical protein
MMESRARAFIHESRCESRNWFATHHAEAAGMPGKQRVKVLRRAAALKIVVGRGKAVLTASSPCGST